MIGVFQLARTYGQPPCSATVDAALMLGCTDEAAVRHLLLTRGAGAPADRSGAEVAALAHFERPLPTVGEYDTLLSLARRCR